MHTTAMSSNVLQARPTCSRATSFKPARAGVHARKPMLVRAQAEQKAQGPAKAASALLAAVAAAQFAFSGAALAIDPPVLKGAPQIFSPGDAQDIKEGKGQLPSDKYVSQAREATGSDTAANMAANAPTINKKGGGVGRADFAPSQQLQGLRGETQTPPDVRKGTPETKAPMWMNVMPDLSAAPIASPNAEADNDGKANLPKPGAFSKAVTDVGKGVVDKLPTDAPATDNPKGAQGVPTIPKLFKGNQLTPPNPTKDLSEAALGDNKPNFPTPDVKTSQNQDVFKQLGDKLRGAEPGPGEAANPGKVGEAIANNVQGPDPKKAASEVSKNLPEIAQKTDIAPESIGAKANARN